MQAATASLVFQYLSGVDKALANQFQKRRSAKPLPAGVAQLDKVVSSYFEGQPHQRKLLLQLAPCGAAGTASKHDVSSSDDSSSEEEAKPAKPVNSATPKGNTNSKVNAKTPASNQKPKPSAPAQHSEDSDSDSDSSEDEAPKGQTTPAGHAETGGLFNRKPLASEPSPRATRPTVPTPKPQHRRVRSLPFRHQCSRRLPRNPSNRRRTKTARAALTTTTIPRNKAALTKQATPQAKAGGTEKTGFDSEEATGQFFRLFV
ncbi:hypothetical protein MRX96_011118 [Rhipicephalus microplus]